ncbi:UNVERIFIED_ORG: hypothetical protein J2Y94_002603 [Pseudomonas poae]
MEKIITMEVQLKTVDVRHTIAIKMTMMTNASRS